MDLLAELIGASPVIESVRENVRRLVSRQRGARRMASVLIQGETGTGKGLVARLIHRAGPRPDGPFVDVNCAAIPDQLLEAELFGFERGAFTDARRAKPGLFQTAHRGTIFLDEIGLLPETLQAKLLKVLEEQAVRRLGSTTSEPIDTWIISVTNTDLQAAIRTGRFREDLYHRLAVLTMHLPPLRERGRDVLLLAERFLARSCADYGLPEKTLTPSARARLLAYPWPGNVRELSNVIERVALLADGDAVTGEMLAFPEAPAAPATPRAAAVSFDDVMRDHLLTTLKQTRWNISRTAAILGISRNTLRARIERFGIKSNGGPPQPGRPVRVAEPVAASAASSTPPTPSTIRWERRRITLMRAVLIGADAEAPTGASRALDTVVDKVKSFGGRVEEMSPRSIGATFGLDPAEDATKRAAHAASAIQKAAERATERAKEQFAVKIGIHVAQVLVGQSAHSADIESEAKRAQWLAVESLMAQAVAGTTLVSSTAAPFLERSFHLAPAGESRVEPLYTLGARGRTGLAPRGRMAAFVGRHQELDLLKSRLESVKAGHGQLVGIVGEAGIGKSRLLHEFRKSLKGRHFAYLDGHCVSYGTGMPYLPVIELLRQGCRITDADTPEEIAGKLRTCLERLGMDAPSALPYLLQLLGIKEDAEELSMISTDAIQARTFGILRQMCLGASRQTPLIVTVEDMHWIDASSEAFAATMESLANLPLLLIVTYRPGYQPPWADRWQVTQIALQPLSEQDSASVVQHLLPPARKSLTDLIVAKAKGNPFFLEELARSAALQEEVGSTLSAPDTIEDVLLARVNRLAPATRQLLETAAVLGREAPRELLTAVWDDPAGLDAPLRDLIRQEFLYSRPSGDEPTYVFKHVLVQEVVYASLGDRRRQPLHDAAGEAIESLYAGRNQEVVDLLAHHFRSGDSPDKAVDYALLAADRAHRRGANLEALAHFETARSGLDGMPDSPPNRLRRIDAVVKQAEVQFELGRHAEHIQALEGIRPLVESSPDPARRGAWYGWTGFLHSLTGSRPEVVIEYCREAASIADAAGLTELRAFAECCLAHAHEVAGNLWEALAAGERALPTFEATGNVWWACRTLWHLNTSALFLGDWQRSTEYCRRALAHGQSVDDLRLKIVALSRLASTHIQRGDHEMGLRYCEEASALSPGPFDAAMLRIVRGHGLVRAGEAARGIGELRAALAWLDQSKLRFTRSLAALRLAEAYLAQGDREDARALLGGVLTTSQELGYRYLEGVAERLFGESFLADDAELASRHLEEATAILDAMGARDEFAKALVNTAELCRMRGEDGPARDLLERAAGIFDDLGVLADLGRARALLLTP